MTEEQIKSILEDTDLRVYDADGCADHENTSDAINQAAAEIMKLMQGWVSPKYALPKPNKRVLLFVKRQYEGSTPTVIGHYIPEGDCFLSSEFHDEEDVSIIAWHPLPTPPPSSIPNQNR